MLRGRKSILGVLVIAAVGVLSAWGRGAAPKLSEAVGVNRGVCVITGEVDAGAVVELAKSTELTVCVQARTDGAAKAVREGAEQAGLLGKRIFVDYGATGHIGFAANVVDSVVVMGEGGAAPAEAEVLRVLRPGGKGVIGGRQIVKPAVAGTDTWSHPYHGPDNNPLSTDRLAKAPYLTQFLAEPLFSSQPEVTVAAGGRIFKAFGHMTFRAYQNPSINRLLALSAYNGTLLWERDLKPGFMIHRNTMIATADTLYMADEESCKMYDAATGKLNGEIKLSGDSFDGPVWKWMALQDGVLYALIGGKEVQAPVAKGTDTRIGGWPWGMWPGYEYADPKTAWGFGRTFVAMDFKNSRILWMHKEDQYIDSRGLCMRDGKIYYYCPDKFLACLDAKTGKPTWKNSDGDLLAAGRYDGGQWADACSLVLLPGRRFVIELGQHDCARSGSVVAVLLSMWTVQWPLVLVTAILPA